MPFLEEPLPEKRPPSVGQPGRKRGRPKKNGQLLSLSTCESSTPPIQPQPAESSGMDEQPEENQERHEEKSTVQPQEDAEGATRRGEKRRAESEGETSDDATVAKRVCIEQIAQPISHACRSSSASAEPATTETDDVIDVETVSLTSAGERLEREERKEKPAWSEIKLRETVGCVMDEEVESSGDEIIDVDGGVEDDCHKVAEKDGRWSRTANPPVSPASHSAEEVSLGSTGSCEEDRDEDIDVIGGSSPVPDPVIISWTESSEGEREDGDEDVDVDGEKTDYSSSAVFSAVSKGELVNRKYQTEVLLH